MIYGNGLGQICSDVKIRDRIYVCCGHVRYIGVRYLKQQRDIPKWRSTPFLMPFG